MIRFPDAESRTMKRRILTYPDPVLANKAEDVPEITPEIRQLALDMAETMYSDAGIGLAAPQVGEPVRLIVVDVTDEDQRSGLLTLINPRIAGRRGEVESEEGCLSVPGYRSTVIRSETVRVEALDLDGKECAVDADGLLAICLQHEIDHLDGVLFIDRLSRLKRSFFERRLKRQTTRKQEERN